MTKEEKDKKRIRKRHTRTNLYRQKRHRRERQKSLPKRIGGLSRRDIGERQKRETEKLV